MTRRLVLLSLLLSACGAPETSTPPDDRVRVQVVIAGGYQGLPITVTADPLPEVASNTVFGRYGNQYEIRVSPENLDGMTFDLLAVDEPNHTGIVVKTVRPVAPLVPFFDLRAAIQKKGPPAIIGLKFVNGSAFDETDMSQNGLRISHAIVKWPNGEGGDFISG